MVVVCIKILRLLLLIFGLQDKSLEFEKKRNRPLKYDRDLMATTIRAIKSVDTIKVQRQKDWYRQR